MKCQKLSDKDDFSKLSESTRKPKYHGKEKKSGGIMIYQFEKRIYLKKTKTVFVYFADVKKR